MSYKNVKATYELLLAALTHALDCLVVMLR